MLETQKINPNALSNLVARHVDEGEKKPPAYWAAAVLDFLFLASGLLLGFLFLNYLYSQVSLWLVVLCVLIWLILVCARGILYASTLRRLGWLVVSVAACAGWLYETAYATLIGAAILIVLGVAADFVVRRQMQNWLEFRAWTAAKLYTKRILTGVCLAAAAFYFPHLGGPQ